MKYNDLVQSTLTTISAKDLKKLKSYRDEYGLLPSLIFELTQEIIPPMLTPEIITDWLSGVQKKGDPILLQFILRICREIIIFRKLKPK